MKKFSSTNHDIPKKDNGYVFSHSNYWEYKKRQYRFDIYTAIDFSQLKNVKQVYGLVFNEQNQLLIVWDKNNWVLPGGGIEEWETMLDTLHREIYEEAAVKIKETGIKPFFFQKVYKQENGEWIYQESQVRYICKLLQQDEFVADPCKGDMFRQKFVDIEKLDEYLDWGETTTLIQRKALNTLNS